MGKSYKNVYYADFGRYQERRVLQKIAQRGVNQAGWTFKNK
ncbi:hypothetical protein KKH3_28930 [Pectobacterium actinidiae]|nr:hypothetical protein KKH3_28930 [Pectobacterium actinidiae]